MKCPYCMEEIPDEALVCRICRRDLIFFRPLQEKIQSLEDQITNLSNALNAISTVSLNNGSTLPEKIPLTEIAIFGIGLGLLQGILLIYAAAWERFIPISGLLLFLATVPSILLGTWLSFYKKQGWSVGLPVGIIQALIPAIILAYDLSSKDYGPFSSRTPIILQAISPYARIPQLTVLPAFSLFCSSFWVGRWLSRKQRNSTFSNSRYEQLATRILTKNVGEQAVTFEERIKKLAAFLAAIGPILTLAGSIVAAWFGYLGAVQKTVGK